MKQKRPHKYYGEQHRLDLDRKRILVFTLKDAVNKNYYVRIRKRNGKGYFQRSLKTDKLDVATTKAKQLYMEMWNVEDKGLEFSDACFSDTFPDFIKYSGLSTHRQTRAKGIFNRYWSPYFRNIQLHKIDTKSYQEFLEWRVRYWDNVDLDELRASGDNVYHVNKRPTETTLKSEKQLFKQFLYWCETKRLIDVVPSLRINLKALLGDRFTSKRQKSKALTRAQERRIQGKLRKFALTDGQKDKNKMRAYGRARLYYFINWARHTLIRPSTELTGLKWYDVEIMPSKKEPGRKIALINVRHSKTGEPRYAVMPYGQMNFVSDWHKISKSNGFGKPNDYVFPAWEGGEVKTEAHIIGRLLRDKLKLWGEHLEDETSKVITLYSLARHTGITRRIEGGWQVGQVATAAGSSVKQISMFYYQEFVRANPDKWANTFKDGKVKIDDERQRKINEAISKMEFDMDEDIRDQRIRNNQSSMGEGS